MKRINAIALLSIAIAGCIGGSPEARCQEFLKPVAAQAPTFLLMNAPATEYASSASVDTYQYDQSIANQVANQVTNQALALSTQSIQEASVSYPTATSTNSVPNLQIAANGLLAPTSVNQYEEIPTIPNMDYGFKPGHGLEVNASSQSNQYGRYASYVLPTVSTGPVNLNTVDCPFLGANRGQNLNWIYTGKKRGWVDLQETASGTSMMPVVR